MTLFSIFSSIFTKVTLGFALIFFPAWNFSTTPHTDTPAPFVIDETSSSTPTAIAPVTPPPPAETEAERVVPPPPAPIALEIPQEPTATTPPPPPPPPPPTATPSDLNSTVRESIVNILCTGSGGPLNPASGSGVFIDPSGVILTNAHLGQFFLLKDYPVPDTITCVIRTGSPARTTYAAELLYISPSWLNANAHKIVQPNPTGTGEYDFALLRVTGRTDPNAPLPTNFPFVDPDIAAEADFGEEVLLAGYPAGFLDGATIQTNLYATSAFTTVQDLYNFSPGEPVALISIAGTVVSQHGASGGAVVRTDSGKLQGIIVTATEADTTAGRDLRAITLLHIDDTLRDETGAGLSNMLSGDLATKGAQFRAGTAPSLTKLLVDALEK